MRKKIAAQWNRYVLAPLTRVLVWLLVRRGLVAVDRNSLNFTRRLILESARNQAVTGPFNGVSQGVLVSKRKALHKQLTSALNEIDNGVRRGLKGGA